jgi:hypothetical protein
MSKVPDTASPDQEQHTESRRTVRGHVLRAVEEYLPGPEPTEYPTSIGTGQEHRTRYWRCRRCGQERNRPKEFAENCDGERTSVLEECGYSVADPRTRRALTEAMTVHFEERGARYRVESASATESGADSETTYVVDIGADTCSCPDHQHRGVECKHLRRVRLSIAAGSVPGPDGTFDR